MAGAMEPHQGRTAAGSLESARQLLFAMALHLRAAEPAAGSQEVGVALRAARQLGHATLDDLRALLRERQPERRCGGGVRVAREQVARPMTAGARRVRVLAVDDHPAVRQGLRAFLGTTPDIELVGDADRQVAPTLLVGRNPDVVLIDPAPGRAADLATITELRGRHAGVEVVVLTCCEEPRIVRAALAAGAAGYVLKDVDVDRVPAAIRAVRQGQAYLDPAVAGSAGGPPAGRAPALTTREREILARLVDGSSNREIGRALGIRERTVQTHLGNALTKLDLHSRTQAALWAVREGLARP